MTDQHYSLSTVASRLDVSPRTVRREIDRGELLAYKVGSQWRVSERALDAYLQSRSNGRAAS